MILSGWKEIAAYLQCGVRTVQRWEEDGLPIHRPLLHKRSHVIARSGELDRWIHTGGGPGSEYPKLNASFTAARKLHDENKARIAELQENVLRIREKVEQLRARRAGSFMPAQLRPATPMGQLGN